MAVSPAIDIHQDMIFRLDANRSPNEMKLRSLEWAVVTQINGEKTVGQIREILALTRDETRDIFGRLIKEGLLELVGIPEDISYIPPDVFDEIQYHLTLCLGPVSSIVLDEVLQELNSSREKFKSKKFPTLIELLGVEISNKNKRYLFQKYMLQKAREIA